MMKMTDFRIKVPGRPMAQPRARAVSFNGKARVYQPNTAAASKALVIELAEKWLDDIKHSDPELFEAIPFQGPVAVRIAAVYPCPKTQYRKRIETPAKWKDNGPDLDNVAKHYMDALCASGLIVGDDRQVSSLQVLKIQAKQGVSPYTTIEICPM